MFWPKAHPDFGQGNLNKLKMTNWGIMKYLDILYLRIFFWRKYPLISMRKKTCPRPHISEILTCAPDLDEKIFLSERLAPFVLNQTWDTSQILHMRQRKFKLIQELDFCFIQIPYNCSFSLRQFTFLGTLEHSVFFSHVLCNIDGKMYMLIKHPVLGGIRTANHENWLLLFVC